MTVEVVLFRGELSTELEVVVGLCRNPILHLAVLAITAAESWNGLVTARRLWFWFVGFVNFYF